MQKLADLSIVLYKLKGGTISGNELLYISAAPKVFFQEREIDFTLGGSHQEGRIRRLSFPSDNFSLARPLKKP